MSIPRTIDAYHTYADEKGRADARAAHKTSDPLMYKRLAEVEMERDTLLATLEANQEDTDHVEKFKQEILHLKMVREKKPIRWLLVALVCVLAFLTALTHFLFFRSSLVLFFFVLLLAGIERFKKRRGTFGNVFDGC